MIYSVFQKKIGFWGILCSTKHGGNHASWWIRDLWSKGVSLILAYLYTFLIFCVLDDFFCFSKESGFWVFLVHPETRLPDGDLWSKGVSLVLSLIFISCYFCDEQIMISSTVRSSTNLNMSSGSTMLALSLLWAKYSRIPNRAPWSLPPFNFLCVE